MLAQIFSIGDIPTTPCSSELKFIHIWWPYINVQFPEYLVPFACNATIMTSAIVSCADSNLSYTGGPLLNLATVLVHLVVAIDRGTWIPLSTFSTLLRIYQSTEYLRTPTRSFSCRNILHNHVSHQRILFFKRAAQSLTPQFIIHKYKFRRYKIRKQT